MLNIDMKRKINTLRDILVGRIPDPKTQVEQITLAMIFKFMDDIDTEFTGEWGGDRTFFVKTDKMDYSKYAWSNIMSPQVSGEERSNLYREGIENMAMNPHIPQLFRDIFRNAYLPFRDPETINMFLKEIDDLKYDNSEDLGNAFEMLLSIMGSQGDAGQFRTPRHIIDMIVEIVDPAKTDSILDPACGTAGFLISAYKHILNRNKDKNGNSTLAPDERNVLTTNITGYDISPDMVRLSNVNLYLHHFPEPHIHIYDTLTSEARWDDTYDVILANPPFMTPKGGINPHNRFRVNARRSEVLFVDYIAEHLNPNGKAGIIVPEGIVFQTSNAYKELRKMLIEDNYLYAVISLPAGVFNPYSGVKTSILLFDRTIAKQTDNILFVKIDNDGFDLGAQRRELKISEIPRTIEIIQKYKKAVVTGEAIEPEEFENDYTVLASKKEINEKDCVLVGERYKKLIISNTDYPIVELKEVSEILAGNSAPQDKKLFENGTHPFFRMADVGKVHISDNLVDSKDYLNDEGITELKLFSKGTILFPKSGASTFLNHRVLLGVDGHVSSHLACIISNESKIVNKYLFHILKSIDAKSLTVDQAYPSLNLKQISGIKIPLPPLSVQQEIVEEIEGYQKILDGARQVVKNYKPVIKIDPEWEMVELGKVCEVQSGGTPRKSNKNYWNGNIPWYSSGELNDLYTSESKEKITKEGLENSSAKIFPRGSLLIGMYDTAAFKMSILHNDASFNQAICGVKPNKKILNEFLYLYFYQNREIYLNNRVGARQRNLNKGFINSLLIPNISAEKQANIVKTIKDELNIIESNKRLIEIYEQKIKDKIAEVWGE